MALLGQASGGWVNRTSIDSIDSVAQSLLASLDDPRPQEPQPVICEDGKARHIKNRMSNRDLEALAAKCCELARCQMPADATEEAIEIRALEMMSWTVGRRAGQISAMRSHKARIEAEEQIKADIQRRHDALWWNRLKRWITSFKESMRTGTPT